jgi:aldose 1-epimerase (EC 5.1.3.3)
MTIKVTNFAASLTSVSVPDKKGNFEQVVLGFDSLESYLGKHPKFGATVGRFANRIKHGEFCLDNQIFQLEKNSKGNSVHGGSRGFNTQVFETDTFYVVKDTAIVVFSYKSAHLEGGFPGNLNLSIAYKLTDRNEVILDYTATTDQPTVVNFTNHSYFNLTGCKEPVLNHLYTLHADSITPVDSTGVPTGELKAVTGTEYDFRTPRTAEKQIRRMMGKTYDINYKLNKHPDSLELVATVTEPVSGRILKAYTTEPGMQFYIPSSNMDYLNGHGNRKYGKYYGFCLEMQHFPDSPNKPQFPSTVLRPGEIYRQTTIYKFENSPATKCHLRIKSVPPPY